METTQEIQYVELLANMKAHDLHKIHFSRTYGRLTDQMDDDDVDYGINADLLTIGLGDDKIVQSAVGEFIVWGSVVARHYDRPVGTGERVMFAVGRPVSHGLTLASFAQGGTVVDF